jgi:hypothetical protein
VDSDDGASDEDKASDGDRASDGRRPGDRFGTDESRTSESEGTGSVC